jgi:hypothetical protein
MLESTTMNATIEQIKSETLEIIEKQANIFGLSVMNTYEVCYRKPKRIYRLTVMQMMNLKQI